MKSKLNPKDLETLEWRIIPGFSSYKISEFGHIIRIKPGRTRRTGVQVLGHKDDVGYKVIKLIDDAGVKRRMKQHHAVALAFLPPKPNPVYVINHLDSDRSNNHFSNLEWVTPSDNLNHGRLANIGLFKLDDSAIAGQVEMLLQFARENNISWEAIRIAITKDCVPKNYRKSLTAHIVR